MDADSFRSLHREKVMAYQLQRLAVCLTYQTALFTCQRTVKKRKSSFLYTALEKSRSVTNIQNFFSFHYIFVQQTSSYFRIGENKLRRIANEYKEECVVMNGNRMLIKKKKLEHLIDKLEEI